MNLWQFNCSPTQYDYTSVVDMMRKVGYLVLMKPYTVAMQSVNNNAMNKVSFCF